ncbi:MAG: hypothetical protein V1936_03660 [Patescibacteria group bacterium]
MPKKLNQRRRVIIFAVLAITLFVLVADRLRLAQFQLSMLEFMLILLGMFTLAVGLMVWQIVIPLTKKLSKKDLKNIL